MINLINILENSFINNGKYMDCSEMTVRFNEKSIKKINLRFTNVSDNLINIGEEVNAKEINEVVNNI